MLRRLVGELDVKIRTLLTSAPSGGGQRYAPSAFSLRESLRYLLCGRQGGLAKRKIPTPELDPPLHSHSHYWVIIKKS